MPAAQPRSIVRPRPRRAGLAGLTVVAAVACGDQLHGPGGDGPGGRDPGAGAAADAGAGAGSDGAESRRLWGRLASPGHEGQPAIATLFFAGEARDGSTRYEFPASSNLGLYTEQPLDARNLHWSSQPASRFNVLDQMVDIGINVVYLSYWGTRGTDTWSRFAPMQSSTFAHDEVLDAIGDRPILVVPFIESHSDWTFRGEFPGQPGSPAPGLVAQLEDLVDRIVLHPRDPDWPRRWAQMYGADGTPRRAVVIIHASSDSSIDDQAYADGLDAVADAVEAATGERVGFLLDALPPGSFAPGTSFATPSGTAGAMRRSASVIGISCFLPEIWVGFDDDPDDAQRLAWKRDFTEGWARSGVPTLVDVSPGYDASIVFPGSVRYGHTAAWRGALRQLVADEGSDGLVLNSWNGYTEAMDVVPTTVEGDTVFRWAEDLAASVTRPH